MDVYAQIWVRIFYEHFKILSNLHLSYYSVVDEDCFRYTGKFEKCHIPRRGNLLTSRCRQPLNKDRKDKYKVAPAYRLGNETDVMYEIIHSGPVQGN